MATSDTPTFLTVRSSRICRISFRCANYALAKFISTATIDLVAMNLVMVLPPVGSVDFDQFVTSLLLDLSPCNREENEPLPHGEDFSVAAVARWEEEAVDNGLEPGPEDGNYHRVRGDLMKPVKSLLSGPTVSIS